MKLYRICIASKLICIMASAGLCADSPVDLFADLEDWNGTPVVTSSEAAPSTNEIADPTSVICTEPDYPSTPASPPPVRAPIDLDDLFSQGKERYAEEDWTVAQQRFEAVLQQDPYHDGATKWLKRTLDKQTAAEKKQTLNTRAHMLETVQAAWNTPKTIHEIPPNENQPRELSEQDQQALRLQDKLETIRIPQLAFQATDIQRVIEELATRCRELDPEQSGVNIILFGTADISVAPVTFTGNNLSAREALDIVTQISGMKYEVGATCVRVTPVHYESPQQMVAAEFDLTPAVGKKLASRSSTQPGGLCDVRDFFTTIPFPVGSSAHYNPEFNVLLVRHSPKYIDHVSAILERYKRKELEERSRQVEIETKFIEVEQGALDELGFNWTVGEAGDTMTAGALGMPGGQNLFTDSLRDGQESFATGINPADRASSFNSYANETYNPTGSGLVGTASELMVQKIKGAPVDLVIRALERMSGSDLLSAPKILTKSGEVARIHVGEVHWFPSAYDVEIERYAQPSLVPLDYVEERTGVLLEVTPELDPEHGTINMKLAPEIRELIGFDEQHVSTIIPSFGDVELDLGESKTTGIDLLKHLTAQEEGRMVNADRLIARRPVFKTRKVDTFVTIENGSTIAMGGLIKEQLQTFRDSVPFLGKIPLLGRLFRSEGEQSVKRNLIIFVTANQVNASGYKHTNP